VPDRDPSEGADLFDFVDEFLADRDRGEAHPLAHYLARYPRNQDAVAREFLELRAQAAPSATPESPVEASVDPAPRVGPYRILSEIGRGGQGAVFLAEDTRIARKVALKVLASRLDLVSEESIATALVMRNTVANPAPRGRARPAM
jgi:serine/threonine protein kinase